MKAYKAILMKLLLIYLNFILINVKPTKSAEVSGGACENFYEYACRNYSRENPDPNYNEITQQLDYEINRKLVKLLERETPNLDYDSRIQTFYDKMYMYLESCEKETQRNLRKYLKLIKPGENLDWPLVERTGQWLASEEEGGFETKMWSFVGFGKLKKIKKFDYWSLLGDLQAYGLNNVIIKQQFVINNDNSLNIWLEPALLADDDKLPDKNILKVLLMAADITDVETVIEQLKDTESKWLNITADHAKNSSESLQTNLKDLENLFPYLELKLYLKNLLGPHITELTNITLENWQYFEYLNQKLWSDEELEQLCNYLMIKFLFYLAQDSTADYTSMECIKDLRRKFDLAVNYFSYRLFFKREADNFNEALGKLETEIVDIMAKYFEENLLNLTRKQINFLKSKLHKININNGNLPKNFNFNAIQKFYQDLPDLDRGNYYKNHLLLLKQRFRKSLSFSQYDSHFIVSDNRMGAVSSPFYVPQQNMVIIPFGSFQLPLYNYNLTSLQQLSLFGFVLAHELSHAFDTNGLNFDPHGLALPSPSDIMDQANFTNSLECMQKQEPTDEIDERIADLFAIRVVYRVYAEYYAKEHKANWQKEFFMNLSQFFCGKGDINFIDHDADNIRLQQILMNFRPFAEAFGCAEDSAMNPKTKCRLY